MRSSSSKNYDARRELLREFLTRSGYVTVAAANGADALDRARALLPRVILLDLSLPLIPGWDVARALKTDLVLAVLRGAFARDGDRGA